MAKPKHEQEDFDLQEMVERVIDANYDPSVLDEVEEYRPDVAPNIFEWLTNPKYLGTLEPWPRQVYFMTEF